MSTTQAVNGGFRPDGGRDKAEKVLPGRVRDEILRAVGDVRYGSVEVIIHDSQVVQVERREKIRFQGQARHAASAMLETGTEEGQAGRKA